MLFDEAPDIDWKIKVNKAHIIGKVKDECNYRPIRTVDLTNKSQTERHSWQQQTHLCHTRAQSKTTLHHLQVFLSHWSCRSVNVFVMGVHPALSISELSTEFYVMLKIKTAGLPLLSKNLKILLWSFPLTG